MSRVVSEMETRAELALMGKVVKVRDNSEVIPMTEHMLSAMGVDSPLNPCDFSSLSLSVLLKNPSSGLKNSCVNSSVSGSYSDTIANSPGRLFLIVFSPLHSYLNTLGAQCRAPPKW